MAGKFSAANCCLLETAKRFESVLFLIPIFVFTVLLRKQLLRGITFGAVRK